MDLYITLIYDYILLRKLSSYKVAGLNVVQQSNHKPDFGRPGSPKRISTDIYRDQPAGFLSFEKKYGLYLSSGEA